LATDPPLHGRLFHGRDRWFESGSLQRGVVQTFPKRCCLPGNFLKSTAVRDKSDLALGQRIAVARDTVLPSVSAIGWLRASNGRVGVRRCAVPHTRILEAHYSASPPRRGTIQRPRATSDQGPARDCSFPLPGPSEFYTHALTIPSTAFSCEPVHGRGGSTRKGAPSLGKLTLPTTACGPKPELPRTTRGLYLDALTIPSGEGATQQKEGAPQLF
jgi:hypothetical protein